MQQMDTEKIPLVVIAGPTASGKTALAVDVAKQLNGEIISADSMQIYRELNIGTAKPTQEEMQGIPHHMMDFLPPNVNFSVAEYVAMAKECIAGINNNGKLPILAGGTGLYISSLVDNISFTESDKSDQLRQELRLKAQEQGGQSLLDELKQFDPESADRLHPNNIGRIIRAIEIYKTTGITMTRQLELSRQIESPYQLCMIGLTYSDRQKLYDRINLRVDKMMEWGLLEEAEMALNISGSTALQAIGYKEFIPYFNNECSLDEAVESLKQNTRRYAKRQLSWFRRDDRINWMNVDQMSYDELVCSVISLIKETLKQ